MTPTDIATAAPVPSGRRALAMPGPGALVIVATLLVNVLALALPAVILQVYDRVLPNQSSNTLLLLGLGLTGVLVIDAALRFGRSTLAAWQAAQYEHRLNCTAVARYLDADLAAVDADPPGTQLDRFNAIQTLRAFYAGQGRMVLIDLPFIVLFLGLIWIIGGPVVAAPILVFSALAIVGTAIGIALRRALRQRADLDDRRQSFIIEVLHGIHSVKGMAMEGLMQRRYERLQEASAASTYRATFISNLAQSMSTVFAGLTIALVAGGGAVLAMRGALSLGELSACTLLASRALQPLLRGLGLWAQFQSHSVAKERAGQLLALPAENAADPVAPPDLSDAIEFDAMSFRYAPDAPRLFDAIDLKIKHGEFIAITGPTGCGKTTLLSLLGGLLTPTTGQVLFDGVDVAAADRRLLRQQIAYVPQQPTLFHGTILDNLTLFQGESRFGPALEAAHNLAIDGVISRLPDGYHTRVGDGAQEELPTGIKQSIATARALASQPRLLLFDEANCSLDPETEQALKATIAALHGKVTVVLASHRPSLLAQADRAYRIVGGRLILAHRPGTAPALPAPAAPAADETTRRKLS